MPLSCLVLWNLCLISLFLVIQNLGSEFLDIKLLTVTSIQGLYHLW